MSDTNEKLKAQLYQSAVTFSQLRKCDIQDVFVHDFNIEERRENGRVTAIIELDFYDYQEGGLLKDKVIDNPKKKLEKPENMAIEGTARIATVITEPNFMAGAIAESMTIDSVRVGDGYNFDDVSVSDIDTNKMRNLVKK